MKTKILFFIHDLGGGGAEKVLVHLVNHMNHEKFDVHVTALFGGGVNEKNLASFIHYRAVWPKPIPGNSKLMKLLSPRQLHNLCIKEHYDIEVAYLEGPDSRIISGCPYQDTKLYCWIHSTLHSIKQASGAFRSYREAQNGYAQFRNIVCVSESLKDAFQNVFTTLKDRIIVRYNTIETDKILALKDEPVDDASFRTDEIKLVAVGKICMQKGFDRLARILTRLRDAGIPAHMYALGEGPDQQSISEWLKESNLSEYYTFLGYQKNPYKYVSKCDLFVCASLSEGFSTAATEALIVGTPVCTVEVSGMKEMLGVHNEWGVVTENDDEALYQGIRSLISDPALLANYREKAQERGKTFSTENTVKAVEALFEGSN